MWNMTILVAQANITWYVIPLAAVISLVYSASRYELTEVILRRAARLFLTILAFLGIVFAVMLGLSFNL